MKEKKLTEEILNGICRHMNQDHKDALISYAHFYGGIKEAKTAKIIYMNSEYMEIETEEKKLKITFEEKLKDRDHAHQTLVSMLRKIP